VFVGPSRCTLLVWPWIILTLNGNVLCTDGYKSGEYEKARENGES
jgi:hypothetical protein